MHYRQIPIYQVLSGIFYDAEFPETVQADEPGLDKREEQFYGGGSMCSFAFARFFTPGAF
ncbi:hypothetical protein [Pedobacter suwonensis]|uniref:hypothetical protein n=1 Tax=Pedobacter suwonensis TaxID=332999 RepID=UPI0025EFC100|nr:hypothetical protein [uncultured Pedobacter sp.]